MSTLYPAVIAGLFAAMTLCLVWSCALTARANARARRERAARLAAEDKARAARLWANEKVFDRMGATR